MVEVFDAIATKELVVGTGSKLTAPSTQADDILLFGGGITFENTTSGYIMFADAGSAYAGQIWYSHANDYMMLGVNAGQTLILTENMIALKEATSKTPTIPTGTSGMFSGGIFISGGALWYKGFAGSYTQVAVS